MHNAPRLAGAAVLVAFAVLAAATPLLAPYDPRLPTGSAFELPGPLHLFGTNDLGQDSLSAWLWGARASLQVAAIVAAISTGLAWAAGLAASLVRFAEHLLMGAADLLLALPAVPLYLLVLTLVGPSQMAVVLVLSLVAWPAFARVVRAHLLAARAAPHVEAARALGATTVRIAWVHLMPGTLSLLPAHLTLAVRYALFAETTLAFLGLGDPAAPGWGSTIGSAFSDPLLFSRAVWPAWVLPPALSIVLVVVATTWLVAPLSTSGQVGPK